MTQNERHLVLFFDVNKTVIMHDPVQGKGLDNILNDLLCERAIGSVSEDGDTWAWNRQSIHDESLAHPDFVSYGQFLRSKYPMSADPVLAKHNKKMRKILRQDFMSPGNAGHGLIHEHHALLDCLRLPVNSRDPTRLQAAGLDESPFQFIIPAFFRLIQHLHSEGTSFNLVFRTYGDDLHRIAQEFNLFCSGQHPFYTPGATLMDGSNGSIDRRLHLQRKCVADPHRHGTFHRSDDNIALVMGTFEQPKTVDIQRTDFYRSMDSVDVVEGLPNIHQFLTERWRDSQSTLAIRDFYPHWFSKLEDASAGKLMTIDPSDSTVHCVFFDDNILAHEPHIVDVRCVPDGQPMAWEVTRDKHLMRVEPLDAVRDERYFINRLSQSLSNLDTGRHDQ